MRLFLVMGGMDNAAAVHARRAVMRAMVGGMVFAARRRTFARETRARTGKRNHAGQNGAEQGQKDDRLIHAPQPFIRLMSSTAIEPRLR